jgi:uncharacterized protein YbjT (DUF2867 family)
MQNQFTKHAVDIRKLGEVLGPAGRAPHQPHRRPRYLSAVAARVHIGPGHEGRAYPLMDAEALDYDQMAAILTELLGRPIRDRRPSPFALRLGAAPPRSPVGLRAHDGGLHVVTRLGLVEQVTDDVPPPPGPPRYTFQRFAQDQRAVWNRPGPPTARRD